MTSSTRARSDEGEVRRNVFQFKTFGPLEISADSLDGFWDEIEAQVPKHRTGLRHARGVYIFVTKASKLSVLVPRYVGKTNRPFEKRFKEHRNGSLFPFLEGHRGKTYVFLLARLDEKGSFYTGDTKLSSTDALETLVIERCLQINVDLRNEKKVRYVRGLRVPGFINSPKKRLTGPASRLNQMLGTINWEKQ